MPLTQADVQNVIDPNSALASRVLFANIPSSLSDRMVDAKSGTVMVDAEGDTYHINADGSATPDTHAAFEVSGNTLPIFQGSWNSATEELIVQLEIEKAGTNGNNHHYLLELFEGVGAELNFSGGAYNSLPFIRYNEDSGTASSANLTIKTRQVVTFHFKEGTVTLYEGIGNTTPTATVVYPTGVLNFNDITFSYGSMGMKTWSMALLKGAFTGAEVTGLIANPYSIYTPKEGVEAPPPEVTGRIEAQADLAVTSRKEISLAGALPAKAQIQLASRKQVELSGSVESQSVLSATFRKEVALSGSILAEVNLAGTASLVVAPAVQGRIEAFVALTPQTSKQVALGGAIAASVNFSAGGRKQIPLSGQLQAHAFLIADQRKVVQLTGSIAAQLSLSGTFFNMNNYFDAYTLALDGNVVEQRLTGNVPDLWLEGNAPTSRLTGDCTYVA